MKDEEMMLIGLGFLGIAAMAMGGGGDDREKDPFAVSPELREYLGVQHDITDWAGDYEGHGQGYDDPSYGPTQQDTMMAQIQDKLDTQDNKFDQVGSFATKQDAINKETRVAILSHKQDLEQRIAQNRLEDRIAKFRIIQEQLVHEVNDIAERKNSTTPAIFENIKSEFPVGPDQLGELQLIWELCVRVDGKISDAIVSAAGDEQLTDFLAGFERLQSEIKSMADDVNTAKKHETAKVLRLTAAKDATTLEDQERLKTATEAAFKAQRLENDQMRKNIIQLQETQRIHQSGTEEQQRVQEAKNQRLEQLTFQEVNRLAAETERYSKVNDAKINETTMNAAKAIDYSIEQITKLQNDGLEMSDAINTITARNEETTALIPKTGKDGTFDTALPTNTNPKSSANLKRRREDRDADDQAEPLPKTIPGMQGQYSTSKPGNQLTTSNDNTPFLQGPDDRLDDNPPKRPKTYIKDLMGDTDEPANKPSFDKTGANLGDGDYWKETDPLVVRNSDYMRLMTGMLMSVTDPSSRRKATPESDATMFIFLACQDPKVIHDPIGKLAYKIPSNPGDRADRLIFFNCFKGSLLSGNPDFRLGDQTFGTSRAIVKRSPEYKKYMEVLNAFTDSMKRSYVSPAIVEYIKNQPELESAAINKGKELWSQPATEALDNARLEKILKEIHSSRDKTKFQSLIRLGKLVREDKAQGNITKEQFDEAIYAKGIADISERSLGWARGVGGGTGIEDGPEFEKYDTKKDPFMQTNTPGRGELLGAMAFAN